MGQHTIGSKRGSVRGAPPEVYVGFGDHGDGDDAECWVEMLLIGKHVGLMAIIWYMLYGLAYVLWAIGILPDSFFSD